MLELFVILEHLHDGLHVWLTVHRIVVLAFHELLHLVRVLPVLMLHEEAQVDQDECGAANNTAGTVNKHTFLSILNHFVKFKRSLEKLLINVLVPITNGIINKFDDAVVSVELLQFSLVDSA